MSEQDLARPATSRSERSDRGERGLTRYESTKAKKAIQMSAKAIQNRIRFFQREEEKIWRDLEEVRRQAAVIEEGRHRTIEKRLADATIQKEKELLLEQNKARAAALRSVVADTKQQQQFQSTRAKQLAAQEAKKASQDVLKQKRMLEDQVRLANSERVIAVQRAQIEARLRMNQERAEKLQLLRQQQEEERCKKELMVAEVEALLPALEEQEMICLQRLQNSRIVTQNVLEELETSLGTGSSVANLLRQKQRNQEILEKSIGLGTTAQLVDALEEDSPEHGRVGEQVLLHAAPHVD